MTSGSKRPEPYRLPHDLAVIARLSAEHWETKGIIRQQFDARALETGEVRLVVRIGGDPHLVFLASEPGENPPWAVAAPLVPRYDGSGEDRPCPARIDESVVGLVVRLGGVPYKLGSPGKIIGW